MTTKHQVIFIDDEKYIRIAGKQVLERAGYHPLCFDSAEKAIPHLTPEWPGVVVCDVMMPRMDGYEVCREIRSAPELSGVFVMILTARGQKSDEVKALEVGADLYMSKPFDDEVVLQVINEVFEGRLASRHGDTSDCGVHYQRAEVAN